MSDLAPRLAAFRANPATVVVAGRSRRGGVPRRRCWRRLTAVLALAFAGGLAAPSTIAATVSTTVAATVDVALDDETYVVHASAQLPADQQLVWGALTDYERLREFVPGVTRARVLERSGNLLTIEQVGVFTVLFVELPVQLRLQVQHTPYSTVLATLVAGSADSEQATLRSFTGRYSLTPIRLPERAGVRLDYDARFTLARPLPPLIGSLFGVGAVRRTMREQFEAMLREIARRQAAEPVAERAG